MSVPSLTGRIRSPTGQQSLPDDAEGVVKEGMTAWYMEAHDPNVIRSIVVIVAPTLVKGLTEYKDMRP